MLGQQMKPPLEPGSVRQLAASVLPTRWGVFRMLGFEREGIGRRPIESAVVLVLGDQARDQALVRIHSQCLTGDVLGSLRCDCGEQLELAMRAIAEAGNGILIYEQQEGRGIGLMAKLQAYALQDQGLDTIAANHALGFEADYRDYSFAAEILKRLGAHRIRLLSNNPEKFSALAKAGIVVVEQIQCEAIPNPHAAAYLRIKKQKMGHTLSLV